MKQEEEIEVLINVKYGRWDISEEALKMYNTIKGQNDKNFTDMEAYDILRLPRHDDTLIKIYYMLGENFNGKYCTSGTHKISKKYKDHCEIDEYNGLESVKIKRAQYYLDNMILTVNHIKEILKSKVSDSEKVAKIEKLL